MFPRRHTAVVSVTLVLILGCLSYLLDTGFRTGAAAHFQSLTAPFDRVEAYGLDDEPVKLFIVLFSVADKLERRDLLRTQYNQVLSSGLLRVGDVVVIKHVIGFTSLNQSSVLQEEHARHGDLLLLDSPQNMNEGKTFFYFRQLGLQARVKDHVPSHANADDEFDFIMKLDDDAWLNIPELVRDLRRYRGLPEVYYGAPIISRGYENHVDAHKKLFAFEYTAGMGYLLSKDLCRWLASDEALQEWPTRNKKYVNWEDAMMGGWLFDKNKLANFVAMPRSRMSDFWFGLPFHADTTAVSQSVLLNFLRHDLDQRMILVHRMKTSEMLTAVAQWFWENTYAET